MILNGRAWALEFEDPEDTETLLGRMLTLPPRRLQRRIESRYAREFRLTRAYRCDAKGCYGEFRSRDGARRPLFGVSRGHRYVNLRLRLH